MSVENNPKFLNNLSFLLKDLLEGDFSLTKNDLFKNTNPSTIKKALDFLFKNMKLSEDKKSLLLSNIWVIPFRGKPPTTEEFLTEKYLGPTATTIYPHVKKAFLEFMDPKAPYRTAVLYPHIGWGKSFLTILVNLYVGLLFSLLRHPWKLLGHSPATSYVMVLCSHTMKKSSEILFEPMLQVLESSPYFERVRTRAGMAEKELELILSDGYVDKVYWTTATKTSVIQFSNGLNFKLISNPNGLLGQAQPLYCHIKTPFGYKKLGDLKIGDIVLSPTSNVSYIEGIFPQGKKECYEIIFTDGRRTECCADHLWKLSNKKINNQIIWEIIPLRVLLNGDYRSYKLFDPHCNKDIYIKSINPIGLREQLCIKVSNPDGLYYTDNDIITHNTIVMGSMTELTFMYEAGMSEETVYKFFTKLRQRIESRMKGHYLGRFILDSSPNTLESVIDDWIVNVAPKSKLNYVVSGARWEFVPSDYPDECFLDKEKRILNKEKCFPIFRGGKGKPPKILTAEEVSGYDPADIIYVPDTIHTREAAQENLFEFMKDICGIPAGSADRIFTDYSTIEKIFTDKLKNIYTHIEANADDEPKNLIWNQIKDIFFIKMLDKYRFWYKPHIERVFSVDQSLSKDATAIAVSHVERILVNGEYKTIYICDFTIVINPKRGRINLDAIKYFIEDLITKGNMIITKGSFDDFESDSSIQYLKRIGIEVEKLSVDRTLDPYLNLINLIETGLVRVGRNLHIKNNLKSLVMVKRKNTNTPKIDHTMGSVVYSGDINWETSRIGYNAKDAADAMCASFDLLRKHNFIPYEIWSDDDDILSKVDKDLSKKRIDKFMNKMGFSL